MNRVLHVELNERSLELVRVTFVRAIVNKEIILSSKHALVVRQDHAVLKPWELFTVPQHFLGVGVRRVARGLRCDEDTDETLIVPTLQIMERVLSPSGDAQPKVDAWLVFENVLMQPRFL